MNATLPDILNRIERATDEMAALTKAATMLARAQFAANGDDDEWTRLPSGNLRCSISGLNRAAITRLANEGMIRRKTIRSRVYYAARDWREMMNGGSK